jgi:hypothetical protein
MNDAVLKLDAMDRVDFAVLGRLLALLAPRDAACCSAARSDAIASSAC